MLEIFHYSFMVRSLEAGLLVAIIAPLIGLFLVLRRYSLIADTLAHVSFAGVALGLLLGVSPIYAALCTTVAASLGIEKLRVSAKLFGESALALFLSGSLALAAVLLSIGNGFSSDLFQYLFGSIVTVSQSEVYVIAGTGAVVALVLYVLYKELIYIAFDETAARVSGLPVSRINTLFIVMCALTVSLAIPIVGALLIAALIVIPAVAALQLEKGFTTTLIIAECISVFSVLCGIIASFYLEWAAGGTIVLIMLAAFLCIAVYKRLS